MQKSSTKGLNIRPLQNRSPVQQEDYKWLEKIDPKTAQEVLKVGDLVTWNGCMSYFYLTRLRGGSSKYDGGYSKEFVVGTCGDKLYRVPQGKQEVKLATKSATKAAAMQEYLDRKD